MKALIEKVIELLERTQLVEFDYRDSGGLHHGHCYVRYLIGGKPQIKRMMLSFVYTNVRIA